MAGAARPATSLAPVPCAAGMSASESLISPEESSSAEDALGYTSPTPAAPGLCAPGAWALCPCAPVPCGVRGWAMLFRESSTLSIAELSWL